MKIHKLASGGRIDVVDTRPVAVRQLGHLQLSQPDSAGYRHVSAASGMAVVGSSTWVVSDTSGQLARFGSGVWSGDLHEGLPAQKQKPDLEAIIAIPNGEAGATLVGFGSGSSKNDSRAGALVQEVDREGFAVGPARRADLSPLYNELSKRLPSGLNIEGVAMREGVYGSELLLLHRGRKAGDPNTIFVLDAEQAVLALRKAKTLDLTMLRSSHEVSLGNLNGVQLGFSDAISLPDGQIAFTASAEASDDHAADGRILGSVIGTIDSSFRVTSIRALEGPARKVEGLVQSKLIDAHAPTTQFTLVTDPDDPQRAAEVLAVDLA